MADTIKRRGEWAIAGRIIAAATIALLCAGCARGTWSADQQTGGSLKDVAYTPVAHMPVAAKHTHRAPARPASKSVQRKAPARAPSPIATTKPASPASERPERHAMAAERPHRQAERAPTKSRRDAVSLLAPVAPDGPHDDAAASRPAAAPPPTPMHKPESGADRADRSNDVADDQSVEQPKRVEGPASGRTSGTRAIKSDASEIACAATSQTCNDTLEALLADEDRSWITQSPTAADFVSGARLIAFARIRSTLSCPELARAAEEAETTMVALGAAIDAETLEERPVDRLRSTRSIAQTASQLLDAARASRCQGSEAK